MKLYYKWNGLRLEIVEYCKKNHIPENTFRFLGIFEWKNVYDKVLENFVEERYARKCGLHWSNISNSFKKNMNKIYIFQEGSKNNASYEWIEKLPQIVKCEKVYLLLEENKQRAKHWVAECKPAVVHLIINEALGMTDYYITDKKFHWLITENHHDIVQFIGKGLDVNIIETICSKQKT